jgi:hypothetical protein
MNDSLGLAGRIDGASEILAGILFAYLAVVLVATLVRAHTFNRRNSLAISVAWIFAASTVHRLYHAYLIFAHRADISVGRTLADISVLIGLIAYAVIRGQIHVADEDKDSRFALIADRVGYERMQETIRKLRSDRDLEMARMQVLSEHLRIIVPQMELMRRYVEDVVERRVPLDCEKLAGMNKNLHDLEDLSKIYGVQSG